MFIFLVLWLFMLTLLDGEYPLKAAMDYWQTQIPM